MSMPTPPRFPLGQNLTAYRDGDVLTLVIDLSRRLGPSKSGKTTLIATTNGNAKLPTGETLGLNLFTHAS